jgi:hypothetical protein
MASGLSKVASRKYVAAVKAELRMWRRISRDDESMLRAFSAAVFVRMNGGDVLDLAISKETE